MKLKTINMVKGVIQMKDSRRYVFVGNREFVLREMVRMGLNVIKAWVIKDSYLERTLEKEAFVEYEVITNKEQLLSGINNTDFDILISNGCPHILPISKLKGQPLTKDALFINIHPSILPDLRGKDPLNGACLFNRDSGATCHYMDDGIDTGKKISQVRIPMTDDIDTVLLFQLSFIAEKDVFVMAYERNFKESEEIIQVDDPIYYTIDPKDMIINFDNGFDHILRQARAFGYWSKGLKFSVENTVFKAFSANEITNPYVVGYFKDIPERTIGLVFEDSLIFKYEDRLMRLNKIENLMKNEILGKKISSPDL